MEWPKITVDTTIEEIKRIHKDIWQYVVEHGKKPGTLYINDCVACEYAWIIKRKRDSANELLFCHFCPINWGDCRICITSDSVYQAWANAIRRYQEEIDLATKIRDIPFNRGRLNETIR